MNTQKRVHCIAEKDPIRDSLGRDGNPDGFLFTGSAKPELGFHFGYFMYLPLVLREIPVLIVEAPSVGEVGPMDRACEIVYEKAAFELTAGGFPHGLAKILQCPVIMPLFPRPEDRENSTSIYTHTLASRAMSVTDSPIERVDLQLIAMFQDIKNRFRRAGIRLCDKFIVKGFSSGGVFAHRFTLLHPQYVLAAVGGGNMHAFTLPLKTYQGETLIWPNGMGDTDCYCSFDPDCYKAVKQLFYMGDMDFNDPVPYEDAYTEEERQQVYRLFGKTGMPDRWNIYQDLVKTLGLDNVECKTCPGLDHRPGDEIRDYITVFLRDIIEGLKSSGTVLS